MLRVYYYGIHQVKFEFAFILSSKFSKNLQLLVFITVAIC